jgi:hypothetical protein
MRIPEASIVLLSSNHHCVNTKSTGRYSTYLRGALPAFHPTSAIGGSYAQHNISKVRLLFTSSHRITSSMMRHKILELSYPRLEKRVDEKSYYTQITDPFANFSCDIPITLPPSFS